MISPLFNNRDLCPFCNETAFETIREERPKLPTQDPFYAPFLKPNIRLVRCKKCSFAFVSQIPKNPDFYHRFYTHESDWDFEFNCHGKGLIFQHAKRKILTYIQGGDLLDIGAWIGTFLHEVKDSFKVSGLEIDDRAVEYAKSRGFNMLLAQSFPETFIPNKSYDIVTLIDVLEHLPDPKRSLLKAKEVLKPGGILFIKVPNYLAQIRKENFLDKFRHQGPGIMGDYAHINHFCPQSLHQALESCGFKVLEHGTSPAEIYNMNRNDVPFLKKVALNAIRNLATNAFKVFFKDGGLHIFAVARN